MKNICVRSNKLINEKQVNKNHMVIIFLPYYMKKVWFSCNLDKHLFLFDFIGTNTNFHNGPEYVSIQCMF